MNEIIFLNKELLSYTKRDIKDAISYISKIPGITKPQIVPSKKRAISKYIYFKVDNINFAVRISDHPYTKVFKTILTPIYRGVGVWTIDTLVGGYKPQDLPIIVNNFRHTICLYNKSINTIRLFVKKNLPKYQFGPKDTIARHLVAKFMTENQIDEDRLGVSHIVLENIIYKMLDN